MNAIALEKWLHVQCCRFFSYFSCRVVCYAVLCFVGFYHCIGSVMFFCAVSIVCCDVLLCDTMQCYACVYAVLFSIYVL